MQIEVSNFSNNSIYYIISKYACTTNDSHWALEHPIVDTDWYENKNEHHDIPHHEQRLAGHKVREELLSEGVELVTGADEDEAGQEDVDDGVVWYEDQDPVSVGTEPDVVLGDEQLQVQSAKPGEETERKQDQMNSWFCSATLNICS